MSALRDDARLNASCDFGIEEEYLLVELASRRVLARPSKRVARRCQDVMGAYLSEEMFRSQIEIASPILTSLHQARSFFSNSRQRLIQALGEEGVGLYCAASHPDAQWLRQLPRLTGHYRQVFDDYQHVARRSLLSGLHVHVGLAPECDRMQLINRLLYWAPLLLVLSTSSPFWGGQATGYMSYRRVICGEWPHMGLPESLADWPAYLRYRALLERTGALDRQGDFWWVIRPSQRYPTVELRICDACPRLEDALCIAGLFRHMVECLALDGQGPIDERAELRWVTQENYWRALRYGRDGQYLGVNGHQPVCASAWLMQAQAQFPVQTRDAEWAFQHAREILIEGSSANRQQARYRHSLAQGQQPRQALRSVVDLVLEEAGMALCQAVEEEHSVFRC